MALAGGRFLGSLPPSHTLPVTNRLLATMLLAVLARTIPPPRLPYRPTTRSIATILAAVPRQAMVWTKPLLAPFKKAHPPTGLASRWNLPFSLGVIMLNEDQGSCHSRRPSPGSGAIHSAAGTLLKSPLPGGSLLSRLIPLLPRLHPFLPQPSHPAPVSRHPSSTPPAPWPRENGPQLSRH